MANKTYQGRIVQKHDSSANWAKATNFIPLKGEIIIYDDLNKIKIGDGTTKVNDLDFSSCLPNGGTIGDTLVKDTNGETWETPIEATLVSLPTGILKSDGTTISKAVAGTDYTAPNDVAQAVYKNKTNVMTANGKITMDSSYTPGADGDIATKKYVDNSTPATFTASKAGTVPASGGGTTKYLRADGTWTTIDKTPVIGTNTNYAIYIGTTAPASGTTPLLWIDTTSSTGFLKYRSSNTSAWTAVPVAWTE